MSRQHALIRLHKDLLKRREGLGEKLAGELAHLHERKAADATGDSADLAFEASDDEMSSRMAEMDDRELSRIEGALARWQQGLYGICDGAGQNCQKRISVARLNALPYATFCINCEREIENQSDGLGRENSDNWDQIADAQAPMQDERINLSEVERRYG
jgi:DnaK suppressor protein